MKKCLAFITTVLMLIPMLIFNVTPVSAASTRYTKGEAILSQLGVLLDTEEPKGEFDTVTRSEFVKILMNLMDMPDGSNVRFNDVDQSHPYYGALAFASKLGILMGEDIRPDDSIRYNEVITMLVRALGYDEYAKVKGGYPTGYIEIAKKYGISTAVSSLGDADISYSDAISLLYNAMEVDLLKVVAISGTTMEFNSSEGETILSKYQNLERAKGIVKGTHYINMVDIDIPTDSIRIDGSSYNAAFDNADSYVGKLVEFYFDPEINTIRAIAEVDNDVLTIPAKDIFRLNMDTLKFEYVDDTLNSKYGKLSPSSVIMYNNVPAISFNEDIFINQNGSYTFVDNDRDGKYDVVFMKVFEEFVVEGVDLYNGYVYDAYDATNRICLKESENVRVSFKNELGRKAYLDELLPGDVITVMRSQDNSQISAVLSNTEIFGSVEQITNQGNECSIMINGEVYDALPAFVNAEKLEIGDSGAFRLGTSGRVAFINRSGGENRSYAYIVAGKISSSKLEPAYTVKVLAQDGKVGIFDLANRVLFDGDSVDVIKAWERLTDTEGIIKNEMVRVGFSKDGMINWIDTLAVGSNENPDNSLRKIYSCYTDENGEQRTIPEQLNWSSNTYIFGGRYPVNSDTISFCIPNDLNTSDDEDFHTETAPTYFVNNNKYYLEMYGIKDDSVIDVVTRRIGGGDFKFGERYAVVKRISNTIDKNANHITKLTALVNGAETVFYIKDQTILDKLYWVTDRDYHIGTTVVLDDENTPHKLSVGDAFLYAIENGSDNLKQLGMLYNVNTNQFAYETGSNQPTSTINNEVNFCQGEVYSIIENQFFRWHMKTVPTDGSLSMEKLETHVINKYCIYVYDDTKRSGEKLRVGSAADLTAWNATGNGSKFIMCTRYGQGGIITIYCQ